VAVPEKYSAKIEPEWLNEVRGGGGPLERGSSRQHVAIFQKSSDRWRLGNKGDCFVLKKKKESLFSGDTKENGLQLKIPLFLGRGGQEKRGIEQEKKKDRSRRYRPLSTILPYTWRVTAGALRKGYLGEKGGWALHVEEEKPSEPGMKRQKCNIHRSRDAFGGGRAISM